MPTLLDNYRAIARIDSKDMLGAIGNLPRFMADQLKAKDRKIGMARRQTFRNIVLVGMGGSASAADVALGWLSNKLSVPAMVHRDPSIPRFVGSNTLVVALSYSGDTRETLVAFREARTRAASMIGVGTGGKLREMSEESSVPFVEVQPAPAPRAALGQMIVACADALHAYGVIRDQKPEIEWAVRDLHRLNGRIRCSVPEAENVAKCLAHSLNGRVPIIFAFRRMAAVARRFKNQLAENSKMVAKYSLLPEAAHNEIEALHSQGLHLAPIFVRDFLETNIERSIFQSFRSTMSKASGIRSQQVRLNSHNRLGALLSPILYLDYVSAYLALLRGLDPTDTPWISRYRSGL